MPLSGGTSGAHDDSMHQGSAKRDTVNGVCALNGGGNCIVLGEELQLTRDGANRIKLTDRTSGETAFFFTRVGAFDFTAEVQSGGAHSLIQLANMKDVVNGLAALDAAGALLLPGSKMYYTRDGSDDVHIYERTSNEEAYAFHRVGADDYTFFVKESNVWKQMQTESMKDAADGIAGLDANVLLSPALLPPCVEEYSNHLGAVDNFTETGIAGNGTVNTDAANHEMDLSTGVGAIGHAYFQTKKTYTLDTKPLVVSFLAQNLQDGVNGLWRGLWGLKYDFTDLGFTDSAIFVSPVQGTDTVRSGTTAAAEHTDITPIVNGDLLTIMATSSKIIFFVNGSIVATHILRIPTVGLHVGAAVHAQDANVTTPLLVSVDMMSLKKYF